MHERTRKNEETFNQPCPGFDACHDSRMREEEYNKETQDRRSG